MKSENRKMLALASAMTVGAIVAQHARATTYIWTRGSTTTNNWSNAANWISPDGGTPPPPTNAPMSAPTSDVTHSGMPASAPCESDGRSSKCGVPPK